MPYLGSLILIVAMILGALLWDARRTPSPSQAASRANRHATMASIAGLMMLVAVMAWLVAGFLLGILFGEGRLMAVLPALAGACLLVAQGVGQLTWPRPTGAHREADLAWRTVGNVAPARTRGMVIVWAGTALAALVVFGLVADGPRSITREAGRYTQAIGPYPGWYYGVPMSLAIIALVLATETILRLITLRPAVIGVSAEWDAYLRRRSASHVTRGIQLVLAVTVAGVLFTAGQVHASFGRNFVDLASGGSASYGSSAQLYLGNALLLLALGVALVGLSATVLPLHARTRKGVAPAAGVEVAA